MQILILPCLILVRHKHEYIDTGEFIGAVTAHTVSKCFIEIANMSQIFFAQISCCY